MKTNKMWKRIVSLVMAICMISGMCLTGVSAEETAEELKAIKLEIDWNDTVNAGVLVSRLCLKSMEGKTINAGDTLSYQVYIPSDGNYVYGMGAFDGQSGEFASTGYWFPNFKDGAGMNNFDQLDQQGTDCWITREYTFDTTASFWHLGPAVITGGDNTAMAGKTSTIYYRNIVIKRADGTVEACYTDDVAMGSYDSVLADTDGKGSVSLTDGTYSFKKTPEGYKASKAIKLEIDWEDTVNPGQVISRLCISEGLTINQGDTLSYQLYIPSDGNYVYGMGAMDGQSGEFASTSYWFPNFKDGAGMNNFDQLDQQGTDRWITREYTFDTTASFWHLGPAVITGGNHENMAGKVSTVYYRNIVVKRADGTETVVYGDDVAMGQFAPVMQDVAGKCSITLADDVFYFVDPDYVEPEEPTEPEVPTEPEAPAVPSGIGDAFEFAMTFEKSYDTALPTTAYNWYGFGTGGGAFANLKLAAGDKLSYKVYIPGDSAYVPGMAVIDIQETGAWGVLSWQAGVTDQNGNPYYSDLASLYGRDKWIELTYDLPIGLTWANGGLQHVGPRNNFSGESLEALKGKTAYFYFSDVKIIHADGSESLICPPASNIYNVNEADDFILPYATTTSRYIVEPEQIGNAFKYAIDFNDSFVDAPTSGNIYNWYGFGAGSAAFADIKLNAGDKLSYQMYIPSDSAYVPGMGMIDIQENSAWAVMTWQPNVVDQNGIAFNADMRETYGSDKWIELVYNLPAGVTNGGGIQQIGPRNNFGAQHLAQLAGQTAYVYYKDVKIIHADGTESLILPPANTIYNVNANDDNLSALATVSGEQRFSLSGVSMTLGDELAVNFYVQVCADLADESNVEIAVNGEVAVTLPVAEAQKDASGNYIFTVKLAAAQMTDDIEVTLVAGDENINITNYTIRKYADGVLADPNLADYHALVKNMLNYGAKAQAYFAYNSDAPANSDITVDMRNVPEDVEIPLTVSGSVDGIRFYGASLVFRSKTAVRYYFEVTDDIDGYTFTAGGAEYEPVEKNGLYYIEVPGVNPQQLDEAVTLAVTDGAKTLSVTYSPMSYIVRMYHGDASSELKELVKALYNYYLKAEEITALEKPSIQPNITPNALGGASFSADGSEYVLFGVEIDPWQAAAGNTNNVDEYIAASKAINANSIAIHAPWRSIEPTKDNFDFSKLQYALNAAEAAGLKVVIYFTAANYAAGDMSFVPDYINDTAVYSRIQGSSRYFLSQPTSSMVALPACPSDPDLIARESNAFAQLMGFVKQYDTNHNVLAVQVCGEADFLVGLKPEYQQRTNVDIRCECTDCNAAFASFNGGNLAFMRQQYANYTKAVVDAGAAVYDIPVYTASCPTSYWHGEWRYAEDAELRKETVGRDNYIVGPSIIPTESIAGYTQEMDIWTAIPGNYAWASGLDTGHGTPGGPSEDFEFQSFQHMEMAPWFNIFHYQGLGAIYWDHPAVSITKAEGTPVIEKLRAMWSPLRAASSILAEQRTNTSNLWWNYSETAKTGNVGGFHVAIAQNAADNYGFAFAMENGDIILSATTYNNGVTTFSIDLTGSENLRFERGYFTDNGIWISTGTFEPVINGNSLTFQISGDNGDYTQALYRIYAA